jgi:DNA-binding transcriptional ArsR family regulator
MSSPAPAVHLDRAALAMLAHPLRSRLFAELRARGPATATTLATILQTNTGATSYHLRKLAQVGLVVDISDGRGRSRLWSPGTEFRPRNEDPGDDADADAAVAWLARDYLHHFTDRAEVWLDTQDHWPAEWREPVGLSDHLVQVTADQLSALRAELAVVLERYRRVGAGNPSAKRVSVYLCPLPVDGPPS